MVATKKLDPSDVSKLSLVAYRVRGGVTGSEALRDITFESGYARKIASALTGASGATAQEKRAASTFRAKAAVARKEKR